MPSAFARGLVALAVALPLTLSCVAQACDPSTTEGLNARAAFRDDAFGVFVHWGAYSKLARGEWVMQTEKIPLDEYRKEAATFNPVEYDADAWAKLFKEAGASYVVITAKHHDGFCMWDTQQTEWDIVDHTPYGKDVLKPLAEACERHGLKLFFYYSQLDWSHPDYYPRGDTGRHSGRPESGDFDRYVDYMNAQLTELLGGDYGKVAGVWFDGWWDQQSKRLKGSGVKDPYVSQVNWRLDETYGLIHSLQPSALVGANHHLAPFDGEDFQMFERDLPGENHGGFSADATIGSLPLESCNTINGSWGYSAGDKSHKTVEQLVRFLVESSGRDANLLLNVGPRPDGTIDPVSAERLRGVGEWLAKNGAAIYSTRGSPVPPQSWGVSNRSDEWVYLHVIDRSAADADGWLELTGVELPEGSEPNETPLRLFPPQEGTAVPSKVDAAGAVWVNVADRAAGEETIDLILCYPIAE
ncbi:Alpha-L-fucosidase [Pseudobythopirellula maris]|uniref:alpha-L-fucosidase n=1 Tax=Pseudobythopirellula maris TaxID=2527991 RepID=A0A5C5ZUR6_9BACT|nr:alpha-L-fucosidase [Pseudobythopirellula maris]TWT90808.1 Alpha-L-fucosidase [Pseudobythopirellula maris]